MTEHKLDTGIEPEKKKLADALGEETQDTELLGYGVMYTVGADWNCLVPREWLLDRMNDLGLPQWLAPNQPRPSAAYKRAIKRLREDWLDRVWMVEAPRFDRPEVKEDHKVTVDLKEGDGNYLWHVRAEVFFDEEEASVEGGMWDQHDLGYLTYDVDGQYVTARKDDNLSEDDLLFDIWQQVAAKATQFFGEMQETHIAHDIRKMMYYSTRDYTTNVIQLRRSVYLFPSGMEDFVESMAQLYSEIDDKFKERGEPVAIRTFEVLDTEDKRDWIQHRVEKTLQENVDSILEEAFEEFDEGEAAEKVVREVREDLGEDIDTADTYNELLETQLQIEEVLEEKKSELVDSDHEDIVERLIEQEDIDDF